MLVLVGSLRIVGFLRIVSFNKATVNLFGKFLLQQFQIGFRKDQDFKPGVFFLRVFALKA